MFKASAAREPRYTLYVYVNRIHSGCVVSEVLSIRVPRELKRALKELEGVFDWRREVIKFLEERVRYYRRLLLLQEFEKKLEMHPVLPRGAAVEAIRGDRDSR